MTRVEEMYSSGEKEASVIIFSFKEFWLYLLPCITFAVIIGHLFLRYVFQKKTVHGQLAGWLHVMAEPDCRTEFWPGIMHTPADHVF